VLHARGHQGIEFEAGQFAWLKLGGSPFVFEEHPFTIASTATEPWCKEFTIKAMGDFSELVAGLRPGRRVYLDGLHGRFTLSAPPATGFVLLAGGVGVTPMLSMLRTMADENDPRPALLVVGDGPSTSCCTGRRSRPWRLGSHSRRSRWWPTRRTAGPASQASSVES
jgi:predicted ferric reductase